MVSWYFIERACFSPGQDVEDDVGRVDALGERLGAGRLHGGNAVGQHRAQNGDHLPIPAWSLSQLAPHALKGTG
jgi:hypothetical protein